MAVEGQGILDMIVSLAANEAADAGWSQVSTAHLLIALSRFSEAEGVPDGAAQKELRTEFEHLGIEPRAFRRRLRALLGNRPRAPSAGTMHRSAELKAVFASAQNEALAARARLTPAGLLRCAFASFGADTSATAVKRSDAEGIPTEL